jgi:hypothetical protein
MHIWTLLPKETITDDRAYLLGFLKSVFEAVSLTYLDRTATTIPEPDARPDLILNLLSAKRREALDDIEAKAQRYGVPVSANARACAPDEVQCR